ncbi:bifunctional folylpolyglutamate synthase/dihydrofolate synthase, partial [Hydrogenimonas sp.]|uniref:bifunctional folylpolyglutamate synthase/dihydrofolate synthase n=1 Tax=Hydrogenimonas sp. TaxID=2231112 RepID=UPI002620309F
MLAAMLARAGSRVGHYSSPHILRFNERIWIDGSDIGDSSLESAHGRLMEWLPSETARSLSYFEYTTLLALVAFEGLDYIVLEAGLGGEFDATNVVQKDLSIITPIGLDHQAFLGHSIDEIAATKLRSIEKKALLARQPDSSVYSIAETIAREKGCDLFDTDTVVDQTIKEAVVRMGNDRGWPEYMIQNAMTAAAAYRLVTGEEAPVEALADFHLKGRFERIAGNVILDVGHNLLGAKAVAQALEGEKRVLVYNALSDKNVEEILNVLKPVVKRLEIIDIDSERAMDSERVVSVAKKVGLDVKRFETIGETEQYLVFGSFVVAEAFLKRFGTVR